ncbi:hypothetical protein [Segetibacter aerophilus]|nr:hypothetical protein [Segetibacter aerophilus]
MHNPVERLTLVRDELRLSFMLDVVMVFLGALMPPTILQLINAWVN